jgi:aspartyl-tRNA(Asn)/glutamyl-tRNA(Gln) amidotransferase subunit A
MSAWFPTIAEAGELLAKKKVSSRELTLLCLNRLELLEPALNAFITVTADSAIAAADAADRDITRSGPRSALHGIPIAYKDIFKTKGIRTTAHSRLLQDYVPEEDCRCVELLKAAGAICIGKTATHEFAMGGPSFDLPWPPARNPWDPERFPAGSSSGTGVAVAAGEVLGGMGSDTGGSIRLPAALCGIAGLKPTYGLVSRAGVLPLAFSLDHAGPMAWTVHDCAIMLQSLAGFDPRDPASADRAPADYCTDIAGGIRGVRIGIVRHFFEADAPVTPGVLRGLEDAAKVFTDLGASVRDVTLPALQEWSACCFVLLITEGYAVHQPWFKTRFAEYGERMRDNIAMGAFVTGSDYVQATRRRRELCAAMGSVMADVDILLCAGANAEAPLMTEVGKWDAYRTPLPTTPFNVTGYPALSVCSGYGDLGLPVAIQLAARPFEEPLLLRVGHAFERATSWRDRRPALALTQTPPVS